MDPFWEFFIATAYWFWLGFIIMVFTVPFLFIWFWKKKVPKPARTLFWCSVKGWIPLLLFHDSGRADIIGIIERASESLVRTTAGMYKILPRFTLAKIHGEEEGKKAEGNPNPKAETEIIRNETAKTIRIGKYEFNLDYDYYLNKRSILVGMNLPLYIGYTGSLCILNPEAIALFEAGELAIETPTGELIHKGKGKDDELVQPLIFLDPKKVLTLLNQKFGGSAILGIVKDIYEVAMLEKELMRGLRKMGTILGIIIIVLLVVLAFMFLPRLLGGVK